MTFPVAVLQANTGKFTPQEVLKNTFDLVKYLYAIIMATR